MVLYKYMKQRSTTPVSKGLATKSLLVALAVVVALAGPLSVSQRALADPFDDQISALQSQINQYQAQANALGEQARTLQAELNRISTEKSAIQAQVDLSQAQYDKLQAQIVANEKKISDNKDALGDTLANMYVSGSVSPLEMLASSSSIADYVDQQEYRAAISDTLTSTIAEIKNLKAKLEKDRAAVKTVLDLQKAQREQLAAKEAEQARLVEKTKGEEAAYQTLVAQNQAQLQSVADQQRTYFQSLGGGGDSGVVGSFSYSDWSGNQGCGGGYPYCAPQDTQVDPWGLYNRECVSYVAWALENRFKKYVGNFSGSGNAHEWTWSGPKYSGAVRVYDPKPGDVVVLPAIPGFAPIGHVMIVESVSGDSLFVSQYNYYGTGQYSTMNIGKSGVAFLRFQDKK
jgi:surface antigen